MNFDLQLTAQDATAPSEVQTGFEFPQPLTEKYRPRKIEEFVGLHERWQEVRSMRIGPLVASALAVPVWALLYLGVRLCR